jgi:outer membrane protein assembly factor BamB
VIGRRLLVPAVVLALISAACTSGSDGSDASSDRESSDPARSSDGSEGAPGDADCPEPGADAEPWEDGPSVELVTLDDGEGDGPRVEAAIYPRPDYEGNPWSQWGQGVVLADGRVLSAIGDHHGPDGNSFLYELDPAAGRLTRVGDVASLAGHEPGDYGYGKVHAQMVTGPCGEVYAASYWGSQRSLDYGGSYQGDVLLRLDPERRTTENLGTVLDEHGLPSMAGWAEGGLLYVEAADPDLFEPQRGAFVVLDMATGEQVFATDDEEDHRGFRAMAVDAEGRVVFSRVDGHLARWDPATGELSDLDAVLPGEFLRAATPPGPDGTVYLATQDPDVLLALDPDGEVREIGDLAGYTASLALSPDGSRLWYVPDAHEGAPEEGTPLIEVDTATGDEEVVAELAPLVREGLDLTLGGTYNVAVSADGSQLYLGMNAAEVGSDETFGEVVLVVVDL